MANKKSKKKTAKVSTAPVVGNVQPAVAPENKAPVAASTALDAPTVADDHGLSFNQHGHLINRDGKRVTTITHNGTAYDTTGDSPMCVIPYSVDDEAIYSLAYNVPGYEDRDPMVWQISKCEFGTGHEFMFLDKEDAPQAEVEPKAPVKAADEVPSSDTPNDVTMKTAVFVAGDHVREPDPNQTSNLSIKNGVLFDKDSGRTVTAIVHRGRKQSLYALDGGFSDGLHVIPLHVINEEHGRSIVVKKVETGEEFTLRADECDFTLSDSANAKLMAAAFVTAASAIAGSEDTAVHGGFESVPPKTTLAASTPEPKAASPEEPKAAASVTAKPKKGAAAFMKDKVFTEQNFKRAVKLTAGCAFAFGAYKGYTNSDQAAYLFSRFVPITADMKVAAGLVTGVSTAAVTAAAAYVTKFVLGTVWSAVKPGESKKALKGAVVSFAALSTLLAASVYNPHLENDSKRVAQAGYNILMTSKASNSSAAVKHGGASGAGTNSVAKQAVTFEEGDEIHIQKGAPYQTSGNPNSWDNYGNLDKAYNGEVEVASYDGNCLVKIYCANGKIVEASINSKYFGKGHLTAKELTALSHKKGVARKAHNTHKLRTHNLRGNQL